MEETQASFSVFELLIHASFGVQAIMLILLAASVVSWKLLFEYNNKIKKVEKELKDFNSIFVGTKNKAPRTMIEIYQKAKDRESLGIIKVFKTAFAFLDEGSLYTKKNSEVAVIKKKTSLSEMMEKEQQFLNVFSETFDQEIDNVSQALKDKISLLGTISATAPYVGLLGTVYGILIAFWNLGSSQQATIATVAPSIAEALIATGMGLFVAIPSLIAYNRLNHRIDILLEEYDKIKRTAELMIKKKIIKGDS